MHQISTNSSIKFFLNIRHICSNIPWLLVWLISHFHLSKIFILQNPIERQEKSQVKSSPLFEGTEVVDSMEALHTKDKWVWNSIDTKTNHGCLWIIESSSNPSNYECLDRSSCPPGMLGEDSIVNLHWQFCMHYNFTVTIKSLIMYYEIYNITVTIKCLIMYNEIYNIKVTIKCLIKYKKI